MALDKDRLGTAIATRIQSLAPDADAPITQAQLIEIWQAVSDEIIKEFEDNGDVLPGTFKDGQGQAVTGLGKIT